MNRQYSIAQWRSTCFDEVLGEGRIKDARWKSRCWCGGLYRKLSAGNLHALGMLTAEFFTATLQNLSNDWRYTPYACVVSSWFLATYSSNTSISPKAAAASNRSRPHALRKLKPAEPERRHHQKPVESLSLELLVSLAARKLPSCTCDPQK